MEKTVDEFKKWVRNAGWFECGEDVYLSPTGVAVHLLTVVIDGKRTATIGGARLGEFIEGLKGTGGAEPGSAFVYLKNNTSLPIEIVVNWKEQVVVK